MAGYQHNEIDSKWQQVWKDSQAFKTATDRTKPKYYLLDMFPYPSGSGLHVGHPKGYVATDVVARAKRMQGHNVLRVMGWDSFGLPAERQAVKENKHPREITTRNVATFKNQLSILGLSYDWEHELATSDERYYKWTQWIFLKLYEKGLAYQAEVAVNWCPALGTVLANEEVTDGRYVETGDPVEKRMMKQWMLRITEYAERLIDGLEGLDWPEGIKKQQVDWIGKSVGAEVHFAVSDGAGKATDTDISVFTTRPDTLFGGTYVVLAPEHPLVTKITTPAQQAQVEAYVAEVGKRSERDRTSESAEADKTGAFTGAYATNPVNGAQIPIWIADYVLASYGTGAVFACPAHDERDFAFAKTFNLPIVTVVAGGQADSVYTGDGEHINSEFLNGLNIKDAKEKVIGFLEDEGRGKRSVNYRLRDWLFSRQRYWGEPFPVIELEDGTVKVLPESALPVRLPELTEFQPTDDGQPPLARAEEWVKTVDPETGRPARRETNTMPQWAGSCWYYLRFITPNFADGAWDPEEEKYWMPVDLYVGGTEHATLHLLYARFWHQVLFDLNLVSTPEPFQKLFNQGMVHGWSFNVSPDKDKPGKYYYPEEVEKKGDSYFTKEGGIEVFTRLEKMSKSRFNVVNPDSMCQEYGADALRLYELFMGPLEDSCEWETGGVAGTRRFLDRLWRLGVNQETGERADKLVSGDAANAVVNKDLERTLHAAIKKVTEGIAELRFNTAIAEMMVFVNEATRAKQLPQPWLESFLLILSPFAPHIAEEMWSRLGHSTGLVFAPWPVHDEAKLTSDTINLVVQVGGKMRTTLVVAADIGKEEALELAKGHEKVQKFLDGKTVRREIFVPGRLINFVV